jgi:hypothetical protein
LHSEAKNRGYMRKLLLSQGGRPLTLDERIRILIDAREFTNDRLTGIARVLQGLTEAVAESGFCMEVVLGLYAPSAVPSMLRHHRKVSVKEIPKPFLRSEKALSHLSRHFGLYISPYPKLPLFGVHCQAIHIIHDVLDMTHPLYRRRLKVLFDRYRLRKALQGVWSKPQGPLPWDTRGFPAE